MEIFPNDNSNHRRMVCTAVISNWQLYRGRCELAWCSIQFCYLYLNKTIYTILAKAV